MFVIVSTDTRRYSCLLQFKYALKMISTGITSPNNVYDSVDWNRTNSVVKTLC